MTNEILGGFTIVLPPGWIRLAVDDTTDESFTKLIAQLASAAPPERRIRLRRLMQSTADAALASARERGATDLIVSFATVDGLPIPVSIVVLPLPEPPTGRSPDEHLVALARPGSRVIEVDSVAAIRRTQDAPGESEALPHRSVNYILRHPHTRRWMLFSASILMTDDEDYAEVLDALEILVDAIMSTVQLTAVSPVAPA